MSFGVITFWLGGRVVREPDLWSTGRGFESWPPRCRVQPWASCLHTCASVTMQYNLLPANGRWCSAAGEVTSGLAESNGNIPPVCGLTAEDRDQFRNHMLVSSICDYLFRSTSKSRPNNIRGENVRPSVRTSVRPSVHKKFLRFEWNLVCR